MCMYFHRNITSGSCRCLVLGIFTVLLLILKTQRRKFSIHCVRIGDLTQLVFVSVPYLHVSKSVKFELQTVL